jgi:UDP-N-acetyl-D-galactosamine dehydrogenase
VDLVRELEEFGAKVDVHDPWADPEEARQAYGIQLLHEVPEQRYDAVVLAVAHREFRDLDPTRIRDFGKPGAVIYDIKRVMPRELADGRL